MHRIKLICFIILLFNNFSVKCVEENKHILKNSTEIDDSIEGSSLESYDEYVSIIYINHTGGEGT